MMKAKRINELKDKVDRRELRGDPTQTSEPSPREVTLLALLSLREELSQLLLTDCLAQVHMQRLQPL